VGLVYEYIDLHLTDYQLVKTRRAPSLEDYSQYSHEPFFESRRYSFSKNNVTAKIISRNSILHSASCIHIWKQFQNLLRAQMVKRGHVALCLYSWSQMQLFQQCLVQKIVIHCFWTPGKFSPVGSCSKYLICTRRFSNFNSILTGVVSRFKHHYLQLQWRD